MRLNELTRIPEYGLEDCATGKDFFERAEIEFDHKYSEDERRRMFYVLGKGIRPTTTGGFEALFVKTAITKSKQPVTALPLRKVRNYRPVVLLNVREEKIGGLDKAERAYLDLIECKHLRGLERLDSELHGR